MKKIAPITALLFVLLVPFCVSAAGNVARAQFTTGIETREPADRVTELGNSHSEVYFFTELTDLDGHTVTHRWEHGGEIMAEVSFDVRGPRWRVWSSKQLLPNWTGEWTVAVVDEAGTILAEESFQYVEGEAETEVEVEVESEE